MAKWITVALVAALLFSAGLYAGHSVPFSDVLATGLTTQSNSASVVVNHGLAGNTSAASSAKNGDVPFLLISRAEPVAVAEVRTAEFVDFHTTDGTNTGISDVAVSDVAVSDVERAAIRKLILQRFPNTDLDMAEIWVDTYAGMDLDEINFVLEQKKQTSSELRAGGAISPTPLQSSAIAPLTTKPESALDGDIASVTSNLHSAYSVGYRRMVVLPEAVDTSASLTDVERRNIPSSRFRCFESGPLLQSPIATHVALSHETSVMFCLEGNRVTRRGDFQILTDRRLGIISNSGEFAVEGSTPLPEDAKNVHIQQNGTVRFSNAAGETLEAGRIAVCSITNLANLQTSDGVLFLASDAGQIKVLEHPNSVLRLNSLEQSNVNRVGENLLLGHLKSLSNSSL
jgi:hypothetical protein